MSDSLWDRFSADWNEFENSADTRIRACLGMDSRSPSTSQHDYGAVVFDGSEALSKKKSDEKYSIFTISSNFYSIVVAFIISGLIIFGGLRRFDLVAGICFVVLGLVMYLLMASMNGSNIEGSLNRTIYPYPPTLGADGVSIESRYAAQPLEMY